MNWEVDLYVVIKKARITVSGAESKEEAEKAAIRVVNSGAEINWQEGKGVMAQAASWPFDQIIRISRAIRAKPPKGWVPPTFTEHVKT